MKKILMSIVAVACLVGFAAPSFAEDKPAGEAGEKTEKKGKKAKKEKKAKGGEEKKEGGEAK
jgi:hypothetical protein